MELELCDVMKAYDELMLQLKEDVNAETDIRDMMVVNLEKLGNIAMKVEQILDDIKKEKDELRSLVLENEKLRTFVLAEKENSKQVADSLVMLWGQLISLGVLSEARNNWNFKTPPHTPPNSPISLSDLYCDESIGEDM